MKKCLSLSLLTLIFLSLSAPDAKATASVWNGIRHGYSQDVTDIMVTNLPSICNSVTCSFSPFDTWANINGITGGSYIAYTSSGCSENCTKCAAANQTQCVSCAAGYELKVSASNTICSQAAISYTRIFQDADGVYSTETNTTPSASALSASINGMVSALSNGSFSCTTNTSTMTVTCTCSDGYYGDKSRCNTHSSTSGTCETGGSYYCTAKLICATGYTLVSGKCEKDATDPASDTSDTDTVSGSCPSGLAKSADGCCCIK